MHRAIKVSEETYNKLNWLRTRMFTFPVSYAKIVEYATDQIETKVIHNAKETQYKEKQIK